MFINSKIDSVNSLSATCPEIILASQSPRRQEILSSLQFQFKVYPAYINERDYVHLPAEEQVKELALQKARKIALLHTDAIVIGSDTVVVYGNRVLGQPGDEEEALEMLSMLNNTTHRVLTGIALVQHKTKKEIVHMEESHVTFKDNTRQKLIRYIRTGEPFDKAGAYAIQGKGKALIKDYSGCYHNIVGFPLELFRSIMKQYFDIDSLSSTDCICLLDKNINKGHNNKKDHKKL